MQQLDVPIIQKSYELYRTLHGYQKTITKAERYTLWQKCEGTSLEILQKLLLAGYIAQEKRIDHLVAISANVDMLRVFIRLAHEMKLLDKKKYLGVQALIDEIGRMLGGWIKSLRSK